jgi:hypothetical protein
MKMRMRTPPQCLLTDVRHSHFEVKDMMETQKLWVSVVVVVVAAEARLLVSTLQKDTHKVHTLPGREHVLSQ